ncbi:MAG: hypothetical protein Q8S19_06070 [Bacillota bacterium]|nr:hypothetical protein [Bacillota bacterium]
MGYLRKSIVLTLVLAVAFFAVSTQATVSVWGYRVVRGFYLMPFNAERVVVTLAKENAGHIEVPLIAALVDEALLILEAELSFRPQQTIRVIVGESLNSQGVSGYYQLGILAIAPPSPGSVDDNMRHGPMLHEMTHLAVDYLAHGNYPAWLTEGIAVYLEVRYVGSTWLDLEPERTWSEIGVPDEAFSSSAWDEQAAAYWQSYVLVSYLYELGGRDSVILLLNDLGRGETMGNSLQRTYSIDMSDLTREALVSFRARQEAVE